MRVRVSRDCVVLESDRVTRKEWFIMRYTAKRLVSCSAIQFDYAEEFPLIKAIEKGVPEIFITLGYDSLFDRVSDVRAEVQGYKKRAVKLARRLRI